MMATVKFALIMIAIFIGAYLLRATGMGIETILGFIVVGGGLLFFVEWCFK